MIGKWKSTENGGPGSLIGQGYHSSLVFTDTTIVYEKHYNDPNMMNDGPIRSNYYTLSPTGVAGEFSLWALFVTNDYSTIKICENELIRYSTYGNAWERYYRVP